MATAQIYRKTATGVWRSAGRSVLGDSDDFVMDVTQPVWRGAGNIANNVGPATTNFTTVSTITQSNGATFENLKITSKVTITASNQTFRNCWFAYTQTSGDSTGGQVQTSFTSNYNTTFERCLFQPETYWDRYNGFFGAGGTFTRCVFTRIVDAFGLYSNSGTNQNVTIQGCWIGQLSWYANDYTVDPAGNTYASRANGHSDGTGTHNDGHQWGGGANVSIHGNFYQLAKFNVKNPGNVVLDANWLTYSIATGNGIDVLSDSGPKYPGQGQALLGQANVSPITSLEFHHNWLWNGDTGCKLASTGSAQGGTAITASIHDNIFGGRWRDYGYTYHYYPIRFDTGCIVNGFQPSGAGQSSDNHNNVWDSNVPSDMIISGSPVAGKPIVLRYDAV
ncbi:MAG TPA: hypothetical protein PKC31_00480 [Candidatus Nanoperiomorbaceae bacterium]|nr:hypothetical protein [Candidatus Nanoperiomorbaceae bacterium]HMQ96505.1 hypothetical protein [Candidatus Nanoperiomorbaceae bacterium]HMR85922.1 hypothetical protein [Candidatus Nanoperiomorbaceae bacterium]